MGLFSLPRHCNPYCAAIPSSEGKTQSRYESGPGTASIQPPTRVSGLAGHSFSRSFFVVSEPSISKPSPGTFNSSSKCDRRTSFLSRANLERWRPSSPRAHLGGHPHTTPGAGRLLHFSGIDRCLEGLRPWPCEQPPPDCTNYSEPSKRLEDSYRSSSRNCAIQVIVSSVLASSAVSLRKPLDREAIVAIVRSSSSLSLQKGKEGW